MNRLPVGLVMAGLMLGATMIVTMNATSDTTAPPIKFGMDASSVAAQTAAGVKPDYGTFWLGPWTLSSGWGGPDGHMTNMRNAGVTPAIHFYYWGDDISANCVQYGCWSTLHNAQKDQAGWQKLAEQLVAHLNAKMGGQPVLIFMETEFNKGGIEKYAPFDTMLAEKTNFIRAGYPAAKMVLPFGNWNSPAWPSFDESAAASDYVGIQGLRSSKGSLSSYMGLYEAFVTGLKLLKDDFGKPTFIDDMGLSSYPEPDWLKPQADEMQEVFNGLPQLKALGLQGIIYRSWRDSPGMNTANYHGEAERHWGLAYPDNAQKAAAQVWIAGVKAERNAVPPNAAPTASFNAAVLDLTVTVDGRASTDPEGSTLSYAWDFGDGSTATGATANRTYATGGTRIVRLTVNDGTASGTTTRSVTTTQPNQPPTASFTVAVSDLTVAVDGSASTDPEGSTLSYAWDFGDGTTSTGVTSSHTYATAGAHTVHLTVSDGSATGTTTRPVTTTQPNQAPTASFTSSAQGLTVAVDGSASSDPEGSTLSYAWDFGDGSIATGVTADHTYATGGTRTVRLTVSDGTATGTTAQSVTTTQPNRAPAAAFTTSVTQLVVNVDAAASSDPDGNALAYSWTFGDGSSATGRTASHTYASAGTYAVKLTASDGSLSSTATKTVAPTAPPPFAATFRLGPGVNEWWVETYVTGSNPVSKVEARANSGPWVVLSKTSWDSYAKSFKVPRGSSVVFRATDAAGATAVSSAYQWLGPATPAFDATFTPKAQTNNWWVETTITANAPVTKVEARVNGGAWTTLPQTDWGSWAKSIHVLDGQRVEFRATSSTGATDTSSAYTWG